MDFEVQLTSNKLKRTKGAQITQNEPVHEWNERAILPNDKYRAHNESVGADH